jgi:hypothetical protein
VVVNTIQSKEKEEEMVAVNLYPNPVNDVAFISLEHQKGSEFTNKQITKAEILTMEGLPILVKEFNSLEEVRIDLPSEIRGIYLLKITDTENKNYTRKMLVRFRD